MLPVYILAGGKSSRFGSDKARALLHGEALLARLTRLLRPSASSVTVVADTPDKYADLGVRTIADLRANLGPLGGLLTALRDLQGPDWLLLCSCDMVAFNQAWIKTLEAARTPQAPAVGFKGEHIEPLFALYHSRIMERVEAALNAGSLSPARLLENAGARFLPLPADWPATTHVNTRDELARFQDAALRR